MRSKSWLPDLLLIALAWLAAFWLRFNFELPSEEWQRALRTLPLALLCMAVGLLSLRVPRQSWRYVSLGDLRRLTLGVGLGGLLTVALVMGLRWKVFRARCSSSAAYSVCWRWPAPGWLADLDRARGTRSARRRHGVRC